MDAVEIIVRAEGVRIGLVTCEACGASIVVDPREDRDRVAEHVVWHEQLQKSVELAAKLTRATVTLLSIRDADEYVSADELRDMAGAALQRAA